MGYWDNSATLAHIAKGHTEEMAKKYAYEIERCYRSSKIFGPESISPDECECGVQGVNTFTLKATTVDALFSKLPGTHVVLLNFASYKEPGGKFLQGSSAQEESLCHHSYLFNVLYHEEEYYKWNNENLNNGLYMNRAILSPNVRFFRKGFERRADVLTCAAPNRSCIQYGKVTEVDNSLALQSRIEFISSILRRKGYNPDVIILGAFGCGVFCQDARKVASLFRIARYPESAKVVFAVPDKINYNVIKQVFHPYP